ncbi:hypothetical protein V5799_018930 [Amblyomma americanum]|uniref:Serpin domain-containing protein n=2 Tax=Amblyomma americanum TaxID=6943 RepID=A0AAQ4EYB3_AMBAM
MEGKLDALSALRCFSLLKPVGTVRVSLPLFKVKQVVELGPALSALGVRDVFTDRAELWGSTAGQKRVSAIRHAAAFETAQAGGRHRSRPKGQPGAALVHSLASLVKVPHVQPDFVVDRPFLFFVICSKPETLMLLGSVRKVAW